MARALLLSLLAGAAAQRTTVSIDFGWRWSLVPSATNYTYPIRILDVVCSNQANVAGAATTEAACMAAAAANGTMTYSFCGGGPCGSLRCYIGPAAQCSGAAYGGTGWVTGARNASEGPVPSQPWASPSFNDSAWGVVDLPHDAAIEGTFAPWNVGAQGFLPAVRAVYRKRFALPASAQGGPVFLEVDAALATSTWWVNGVQAVAARQTGYLPLELRLDTLPGVALAYGPGAVNVLTVYCDGSAGSGWWYEAAGLVRHARLQLLSPSAWVGAHGIATPHYITGPYVTRATPALGLTAASVTLSPSALVFASAPATPVTVAFTLVAADGVTVLAYNATTASAGPNGTTVALPAPLAIANAELWSIPRPYLHTMVTTVSVAGRAVDVVNTTVGLRSVAWDPEVGLRLNEQLVKPRGACEHESFAGVGGAIPDRVDLYRAQQFRGAGLQALRTSHNPYEPQFLDMADRLGIIVLAENRVLATVGNCAGNCKVVPIYDGDPAADAGAMALRDRNHASIIFWSLCNEAGCGDGSLLNDTVVRAKAAIYAVDGTRAVTGNMGYTSPVTPGTPMSTMLDVMGMSHVSSAVVEAWHQQEPGKALVMTECCSCESQRGEDPDLPLSPGAYFNSENSGCLSHQTQTSNAPGYVAGTMVWTLHDYLGEPGNWPHVSSSFGAYDLAGLKKPAVAWYRSWWLSNVSETSPDRPPLAGMGTTCQIVNRWQAGPGSGMRDVTVYSNAPLVRLSVNNATIATAPVAPFLHANFQHVPFAPGQLRADCLAGDGVTVLGSDVKRSWGAPAAIVLTVDAPSPSTGTGGAGAGAVYLDGQDVALLRAAVVDAQGVLVEDAVPAVTFAVSDGPAAVWGTGNGDPADHTPNHSPTVPAYHGLARGIVRVTLVAAGTDAERALLAAVNLEAGLGNSSSIAGPGAARPPPASFTVTATSPGLAPGSVTVPLSLDPADAPLAVAAASVASADTAM